jgi:hypothetical protein
LLIGLQNGSWEERSKGGTDRVERKASGRRESPATLLRSAVVKRSSGLIGHSNAPISQNAENHDQQAYSFYAVHNFALPASTREMSKE